MAGRDSGGGSPSHVRLDRGGGGTAVGGACSGLSGDHGVLGAWGGPWSVTAIAMPQECYSKQGGEVVAHLEAYRKKEIKLL